MTKLRYHLADVNRLRAERADRPEAAHPGRAGRRGPRARRAEGLTPTVEAAAEAASISRTTAYRYFPSQRALLAAAHPETGGRIAAARGRARRRRRAARPRRRRVHPDDPRHRAAAAHHAPALPRGRPGGAVRSCRSGRDARSSGSRKPSQPLQRARCPTPRCTASPSPSAAPPGSKRWCGSTDVAGLSRDDAIDLMRWSARAMLAAAVADLSS